MHNYNRISRQARSTEAEAIADCGPHIAKGRLCKVEQTPTGKYLAHVYATKSHRADQGYGVGARLVNKPTGPRPQGGEIRFTYK